MSYATTDTNLDWRNVKQGDLTKVKKLNEAGEYDYYKWDESAKRYNVSQSESTETRWSATKGHYDVTVYDDPVDADAYMQPASFSTDMSGMTTEAGTAMHSGGAMSGYTYSGGNFDPTTGEFIKAAEAGKTTDLLQGYGIGEDYWKYFDDVDMEQLDLIKSGYDLKGKKISSDTASALGEVKQQGEQLIKKMDFATGTQPAIQDATAGVWSEYQAQRDIMDLDKRSDLKQFWEGEEDAFYEQLDTTEAMIDADNAPKGGGGICIVSTALNTTGAWNDAQKKAAVDWCAETHHDGSSRGKKWVKGYHTWGKFLSKWVKRSKIVRYIVDVTTDAFIDVTKRNKFNYLGYIIHYAWINPLSYVIGFSKENKILGKIATFIMVGIYAGLFPLFSIISIPQMIKRALYREK